MKLTKINIRRDRVHFVASKRIDIDGLEGVTYDFTEMFMMYSLIVNNEEISCIKFNDKFKIELDLMFNLTTMISNELD